ncbi:PREDICTED: toll-like receptor Tollo [Nicrophorus vespilloides]|uniref:Toll-like receptor Tollo n=1 Tax=Nicrophorus vespilloides TaxID=110193 RepID=A0ABM1MB71_NICVS|nr:PREDICTED: toll-like receptor Tollo [Nicrophorus vespilloides]
MGTAVVCIVLFATIFGALSDSQGSSLNNYEGLQECHSVVDSDNDITVVCRLKTINSELEFWNFNKIHLKQTVRLKLECSDALFFQSNLKAGSFKDLVELRELSIEYCKLGNLSDVAFRGLRELRNLTVRTHNTDWSAVSLDISSNTFAEELRQLERLDLSENNMWTMPEGVLCPLKSLEFLNLTRNRLREVSSFNFVSSSPSERCGASLRLLDLSRNNIDRLASGQMSTLVNLQKLYLQENGLTQLADRALEGLVNLNVLKLSDNRLVSLPPELFSDTREIRELYLQNNSINVLAPDLFRPLVQLLVLDLSNNELTADWINSATFSGLVRLVVLDLSFNRIKKLEPSVFRDLYNLQFLRLNDNKIDNLPTNTFSELSNLRTLYISNNMLTRINADTFSGLKMLLALFLDRNRISFIHHEALMNCPQLDALHLNGNILSRVPEVISNVPLLKTLDLGENLINVITNDTFADMSDLQGLRLTENYIGNLTKGVFDKMTSLNLLNLSGNKIKEVSPGTFDTNENLQVIRLDGNYLTDITDLFSKLPKLVWLNISDNQLQKFDYAMIPSGLQWLDIHANQIKELGNRFLLEDQLSLELIEASCNQLTEIIGTSIPNSVHELFLSYNLISKVQSYTFFKKTNLTKVDLYGNKITNLDQNSLRIMSVPADKELPKFHIGGNPFSCDCTMEWLQKANLNKVRTQPMLVDLESIYCQLLYNRGGSYVPLVEAAPHQFLCTYEAQCLTTCQCCDFDACDCKVTCPKNCTCYHDQMWRNANVVDCSSSGYVEELPERIPMSATQLYLDGNDLRALVSHAFIGRKTLKVLFLNNSNIENIHNRTFNGLHHLEVLHLDGNRIAELYGHEFEGLDSLREIFLQYNRITHLNGTTFTGLKHLRILKLDHNRISEYSVWYLPNTLSEVTLASNPWSCDCEFTEKLREWMVRGGDVVTDLNNVRCVYNTTDVDFYNENMYADNADLGFYVSQQENNGTLCTGAANMDNSINGNLTIIKRHALEDYLPPLVITLSALGVLLVTSLLVFIFRQEVRVWCHSKFGVRLCHKSADFDRDDRDKLFDAFVSYSSKDEAWVAEVLAPALEPNYKLCLHYRDFPVGAFLADTIVQAVESSKRTIMILSENFIKSEWCRFEFKSAHHQILRDRRRRLIVILLGEVPQKDLDPDIRLYLKTNVYLQWGDKLFWEKLKFALPDVPTGQRRRGSQRVPHVHHHVHRHGARTQQPGTGPGVGGGGGGVGGGVTGGGGNCTGTPRTVAIHI